MVKIVIFFRRRNGMSREAFHEHWSTTHADLILKLPGLRGYAQSHVFDGAIAGCEPLYDAVAESWFDDTQAMRTLAKTPEYAAVLADEPNFIDRASINAIITEEHRIKDGPAPADGVKRIDFLKRRANISVEDFQRRWREECCAQFAGSAAVRRSMQSHTRRSAYEGGRTPTYDGAAMTWFDSAADARALDDSPAFAPFRASLAAIVEKMPPEGVLAHELVFLAPPSH